MAECLNDDSSARPESERLLTKCAVGEEDADTVLMQRAGQNDVDAYRLLVNKHLSRALNFAERMIGNRNDAEDIVQDAFLRVWKEASRWKPKAKFTTWFHRVLYNLCIDYLRKSEPLTWDIDLESTGSKIPDPEQNLVSVEVSNKVREALKKLPERQRAALILFYYEELTQNEAAEVLEVSVSALEALLFRARTTLRKILKGVVLHNDSVEG
jgi:RNA polymerase sigma-70 factor (ECF subfamily)